MWRCAVKYRLMATNNHAGVSVHYATLTIQIEHHSPTTSFPFFISAPAIFNPTRRFNGSPRRSSIILAFDSASECDLKQNAALISLDQVGISGEKNSNLLRYSAVSVREIMVWVVGMVIKLFIPLIFSFYQQSKPSPLYLIHNILQDSS